MLNQEAQYTTEPVNNSTHDPLKDHDYCSPNKSRQRRQQSDKPSTDIKPKRVTSLSASKSQTSEDFVPTGQHRSQVPKKGGQSSHKYVSKNLSNDNLSDSSSSLSSSVASTKDPDIAGTFPRSKSGIIPPRDSSIHEFKAGHPIVPMDESDSVPSGRAKRARQSTSVTDKSEWIMGDDQIDSVLSEHLDEPLKEKRPSRDKPYKDHDFSQYSSSDFSSSDAESEPESDYNSDDDPDKLWCTCRKPHGDKFMIQCDICEDWFHGHCVGVTKLTGDRFEKQGIEWFCKGCQDQLKSGIPREAIPRKIVKKEKKKKVQLSGKRGRGRPRKSESNAAAGPTRVSRRSVRKLSHSIDQKSDRLRRNLTKPDVRSESFGNFEDSRKLKQLIRERKRDFFHKRNLADQQKLVKRNELGLGRQALTAQLSDSLDSLATSTSTPNMSNLPINIKSEHRKRSKPNIVLQINTKKDSGADHNNPNSRIVTAIVRTPKKSLQSDSANPNANDLFAADPIQINKNMKTHGNSSASTSNNQAAGDKITTNGDAMSRKRTVSVSSPSKNEKSEQGDHHTPRKKRKDSESSVNNGSTTPGGSQHIALKIKEILETRSKQIKGLEVDSEKIVKLASEIADQFNECYKEGTPKYNNRFRSVLFNLGDNKNQGLVKNVLTGEIIPARLVRMLPDEMASQELAKWRERENKHTIELIKRDAQLAAQQIIVKKTHKGEEVISASSLNETDEPSSADNESPNTSKQNLFRTDSSRIASTPSPAPITVGSLKVASQSPNKLLKLDGRERATSSKNDLDDQTVDAITKSSSLQTETSTNINDDSDSKNTVSDIGKISNELPDQPVDQPKRFRVSIDTKLDPTNLPRLKEQILISQRAMESTDSSRTPQQDSNEDDDLEEGEICDADASHSSPSSSNLPVSRDKCWSGSITTPEVPKFSALAKPLLGSVDFMQEELNQNLVVCGRIPPDQMQNYIKKLKSTPKNQILIIQLFPQTDDDKSNFDIFFDYLYSRNRYGVIQTSPQVLRDFYILPIHEKSSIPEALKPLKASMIDRKEQNCLLGLLVKTKATPVSNASTSNYVPTPIK